MDITYILQCTDRKSKGENGRDVMAGSEENTETKKLNERLTSEGGGTNEY